MRTGVIISGAGHGALILWLLFGGVFNRPQEAEFSTTDVSILSEEEFLAMTAPARAPSIQNEAPQVSEPVQPQVRPEISPVERPQEAPEPDANTPPEPEDQPDFAALTPPPQADADDEAPDLPIPPAPEESANLISDIGAPRPVSRVAPVPSPAAPPLADRAPTFSQAPTPSQDATEVAEDTETAAPEEAAPEIVTEAETTDDEGSAPASSIRPTARPARLARVQPEPAPEPDPAPQSEASTPAVDPVAAALAEALSGTGDAPTGPPLSFGEKDALRVAVSRCWNVGSASTEALGTTVVVGVEMTQDGKPVQGSVRLISHSGGSDASARQMFEFARRAILRCGATGFDLPIEKYSQWRDIEMTFNPEKMRIK